MINTILNTDVLEGLRQLPDETVNCCVTSPPYWGLRDYGNENQIGLEKTPEEYVAKMVQVFSEVKRVLKNDGTLWLNLGDSYSGAGWRNNNDSPGVKQRTNKGTNISNIKVNEGCKLKDLIGIPWLVAFALRADGWYLRQDIIWHKPNPMPESVTDRCTKSHEYIFLLSKSQTYFYDYNAVLEEATGFDGRNDTLYKGGNKDMAGGRHERWKFIKNDDFEKNSRNGNGIVGHSGNYKSNGEPNFTIKDGVPVRNKRSVWTVNTKPFSEAHFATFPEKLIEPCIKAGCPEGGIVLDPFMGAGTTALVAKKLNRNYIGIELSSDYVKIAERRIHNEIGLFINE